MKRLFLWCAATLWALDIFAAQPLDIRFHNEATDTIRINTMLSEAMAAVGHSSPEKRVAFCAGLMLDTPYRAGTLEGSPETLTINLDSLDCTTFVDNALALAYTIGEGRTSWRDFVYNLQRMRYRKGEIDGYSSRLHYISDWIIDNAHRGNLKEATALFPGEPGYEVKTLDFITTNRDKYPALADSAEYARMRAVEFGYRSHRFPYIKASKVGSKEILRQLRDGDVVAFTSKIKSLDVQHMGIVRIIDGVPRLLHASSAAGKVLVDKLTLVEYLRRNHSVAGIRVFRLNE